MVVFEVGYSGVGSNLNDESGTTTASQILLSILRNFVVLQRLIIPIKEQGCIYLQNTIQFKI